MDNLNHFRHGPIPQGDSNENAQSKSKKETNIGEDPLCDWNKFREIKEEKDMLNDRL